MLARLSSNAGLSQPPLVLHFLFDRLALGQRSRRRPQFPLFEALQFEHGDIEQPDNLALLLPRHRYAPASKRVSKACVEFRFSTSTAWSGRVFGSAITLLGGSGSEIKDRRFSISSIYTGWYLLVTLRANPDRASTWCSSEFATTAPNNRRVA